MRWLLSMVRPYRGRLAVALVALALASGVSLLLPLIAGRVVDTALVERSLASLRSVILGLVGLFALSAGLSFLQGWLLRSTAALLIRDLRARLHGHLLSLPPPFFERERVGDLLSRLTTDVAGIGNVLTSELVGGLQSALLLLGALALLVVLHPGLTGVMLLAVPPVVIVAALFGLRFERLAKEQQKRAADATVVAEEAFAGIRTVQAFAREDLERARYGERLGSLLALALRLAKTWGAFSALVSFFGFSALALVLWYGGTLVVRGGLSPGELTSFLLYTGIVASAVGALTSLYGSLRSAAGATERVRELLDTRSQIGDPAAPATLGRPRGEVAFESLRFSYPSREEAAVNGLSLTLLPGQVVALVGASGAGKSTLVALLLRFHDPQAGRVRLDGVDVRDLRLAELRRAIALVPQDVFLFGGTVAENIRYGRLEASDAELEDAARAAGAHAFIAALPSGYQTVVGERGVRLSAGERQRVAIARALLADPAVVVLDEATSALDAESEQLVQQGFERLLRGRTTLVIAHRLATVRRADRVVVLERGAIVEQGTHAELMAQSGRYRRLCELQMLAQEGAGAT